ncbi:hypothetical protein HDIA_0707 [Hartmannibacter diazotrophicus]|uniref:DUF2815 domain-containing protein n=1 Tax=Hartmannibacter diazotrophicus TaxID=1482074 RepID=A0A2C9D274_9HYPH|nr:ssDNA-binding protein [Hartmannibacter diazotrophicus]SON54248.1 hypothetical protein HDIA_0707 [Hartmannibacter diazotrophicus]
MGFKPSFNPDTGTVKCLVRLSYCKILKKTPSTAGGKLMYRTNGLIMKKTKEGRQNKAVVDEAVDAIISERWPGKDPERLLKAFDSKRLPIFDGDDNLTPDGDVREHYEDTWYLKLNSDKKVKLRNRKGEEIDADEAEELFVSGFWAIAYFHFYAITDKDKGGNGIFATIDGIQYYKRDEEFTGGGIDDSEFEDYGDEDEEDDDLDRKPARRRTASSIDDDEDERPRRRKPADDDEDDRPRRRRSFDDI